MGSLADGHCRHPKQPKGGVCAMCLKDRLSRVSGAFRFRSDVAAVASSRSIDDDSKLERKSSSLHAPTLKQLLGQPSDAFCHDEAAAETGPVSESVIEARQSIAFLIERDIVEAHRPRYSVDDSGNCYELSSNQLLRSKSTSQLDAYHRLNSRSLRNHSSRATVEGSQEGMNCPAMDFPVLHHHHQRHHQSQRGRVFAQYYGDENLAVHEKNTFPLIAKSKSTGWMLNQNPAYDEDQRFERGSTIAFLSWHKRRKMSSALHASMEAFMTSPWTRKIRGGSSSMKARDTMWRPLKILCKWRVSSGKPSFTPSMPSSTTPRSSNSSSSSCTQCVAKKKLHHVMGGRDNDGEQENVMCGVHGCTERHILAQRRGHRAFDDSGFDMGSGRSGVHVCAEQTIVHVTNGAKGKIVSIKSSEPLSSSSSPPSLTKLLDNSMTYSNLKEKPRKAHASIAALISMDVK